MARFKYIGEAPAGPFQMYGATWDHDMISEVVDHAFVRKLNGNRFFVAIDPETAPATEDVKKKGGRPKKEVTHGDQNASGPLESGHGKASGD